ncbi:MAG: alpha/beta hydrolase [Proteobacteria bacterium]|nr:alpha/beta hydrolase [Pseudomonadota bacterium]MCP4915542.1 alpha/beta hydrolase [Pseudomonadota bacterium]
MSWHTSRRSFSAWLAERGYDVHNLELRGHGRSRARPGMQAGFDDYIGDLTRVCEQLDRPFVIGHSLGGACAYAAAAAGAPVRGVVGLGALYRFGGHSPLLKVFTKATWKARRVAVKGVGIRTRLAGRMLAGLWEYADVAGYILPFSGWWPGSVEPALLRERLTDGMDWTSVQVWLEMSRWANQGYWDHEEAWKNAQVPVLVLVGDEDHLMPLGDARGAYDDAGHEDRTLRVFSLEDDGMHWGHLDIVLGKHAPDVVWPEIDAWISART